MTQFYTTEIEALKDFINDNYLEYTTVDNLLDNFHSVLSRTKSGMYYFNFN